MSKLSPGRFGHVLLALVTTICMVHTSRSLAAPDRLEPSDRTAALRVVGRRAALIVGTSEYRVATAWPRLPNASADAAALAAEVSARYGFRTVVLKDPRAAEFKAALGSLAASAEEADDLLVFVAGHGHFDPLDRAGYLVFADSAAQCDANCYPLDNIKRALYGTRARHVLVMLDVCHAGTIDLAATLQETGTRATPESSTPLRQIVRDYQRQASRFILASVGAGVASDGTSGTHSPFMDGVLRTLATPGGAGVVSLERLYVTLAEQRRLDVVRPLVFGAQVSPHPNGTFLFIEDVPLCDVVRTVVAAGSRAFVDVTSKEGGPIATAWATTTPAAWLVPGAERCDVWTWQSDGHVEFRCEFGAQDPTVAATRARELFDAASACTTAVSAPREETLRRGDVVFTERRIALDSGRALSVSTTCTAACSLAFRIE